VPNDRPVRTYLDRPSRPVDDPMLCRRGRKLQSSGGDFECIGTLTEFTEYPVRVVDVSVNCWTLHGRRYVRCTLAIGRKHAVFQGINMLLASG
jgi:hypothetical protein